MCRLNLGVEKLMYVPQQKHEMMMALLIASLLTYEVIIYIAGVTLMDTVVLH